MTSLEIAELTGKRHSDVLEAIRKMEPAWVKISQRNFPLSEYKDVTGRILPCYVLNKTECLYVATKFNDEARAKLVLRWEELEKVNRQQLPSNYLEALKALVVAEEQKQQLIESNQAKDNEIVELSAAITEMRPKLTYLDRILQSKDTVMVTSIAQDYGMSAKAFNILLRNFGIQHKVNGQWILYAKYLKEGYVQSETFEFDHKDGSKGVRLVTRWTQRGRLFLYEELKRHDILPLIERG